MSDEQDVPMSVVASIAGMLDNKKAISETKNYVADESICRRIDLIAALKQARIPGNALIEWEDDHGQLRVNVIDFLCEQKLKAVDPKTGQAVQVASKAIPDGSWRVLY